MDFCRVNKIVLFFIAEWLLVYCAALAVDNKTFGSTNVSAGHFKGDIFLIPEKTSQCPDFSQLIPSATVYTDIIDVKTHRYDGKFPNLPIRKDWFAVRYRGQYHAEYSGNYQFRLKSDDGALLFIDNQLIINNDGSHDTLDKRADIQMETGYHNIEVRYFQGRGKVCLALYVKEPGKKEKKVRASSAWDIHPISESIVVSEHSDNQSNNNNSRIDQSTGHSGEFSNFSLNHHGTNTIHQTYAGEICMQSMKPGGAWAQTTRPYSLESNYSVSFDFKITETDNHFILIYYDNFICVDIDWGKNISHYQPGSPFQLKQVGYSLEPDQWYHFTINASPSQETFQLLINGDHVSTATGIKTDHNFLKGNPVINANPYDVYIGEVENSPSYGGGTYNRGSACWKNISFSGAHMTSDNVQDNNSVFGSAEVNEYSMKGDIYHLPSGTRSLPDFNNLRPVGSIYTQTLNVPNQSFTKGFPGVTDRFEWFGIRYKGQFNVHNSGQYTFKIGSDDGSKVWVDNTLLINNDGVHPYTVKSGNIYLDTGVHTIQVDYFQGPRVMLGLQLYVTEPGGTEKIFSPDYSSNQNIHSNPHALYPIADADVYAYSYRNWNNANFGRWSTIAAGYNPTGGEKRLFMKFDVNQIEPSHPVKLRLYHYHTGGRNSLRLGVFRILSNWDEGSGTYHSGQTEPSAQPGEISWNHQPSVDSQPITVFKPEGINQYIDIDITQLVRMWQQGTPNFGLAIKTYDAISYNTGESMYGFISREHPESDKHPKLISGSGNNLSGYGNNTGGYGTSHYNDKKSIKMFNSVQRQNTSNFANYPFNALKVQTRSFNPIPFLIHPSFKTTLTISPGQKIYIAGNSTGDTHASIDNFLFFEINDQRMVRRFVVGSTEPVFYGNTQIVHPGQNTFRIDSAMDLSRYFPVNIPLNITVSALDYGGVADMSDIYLIIK